MLKIRLLLIVSGFIVGVASAQDSNSVVNDSIYNEVDVEPEFSGGVAEMTAFIVENIDYSSFDCDQSTIYFQFIVEKDGTLTPLKSSYETDNVSDKETLRIISIMPKWSSGYVSGQPVRVAFTIPLRICRR